jgi:O-antigen ligase
MDANSLKIGLLGLLGLICWFIANLRLTSFKVNASWLAVACTYLAIVIHYFYVGYSITNDTNVILVWGAALLALSLFASNAFSLHFLLKFATMLLGVGTLGFLLLNLRPALTGSEDALIDGNYVGMTANANMLGGYLSLVCIPLLLHGARNFQSRQLRLVCWMLLFACSYLILLTRSRAALLVVCVALIFLVLTSNHLERRRKFLILAAIFASTAAAAWHASAKYGDAELLSTRSILLFLRVTAIMERPWLGWGFNADVYNYYDDSNVFPSMEKGNTVLQCLEEFGIPLGTFIVLGLCVLIWRAALVLRRQPHGLPFSAALVGCATHLMLETWLFNFQALLAIYFWMVLLIALLHGTKPAIARVPYKT